MSLNTVQRIAKNTTIFLLAQGSSYILAFFYMMYAARHLGAEGFGILSFAIAFTGIFVAFSDFGLPLLTTREVSRDRSLASKYLANVSSVKVILVVVTFTLMALIINFLDYSEQAVKVVYLMASYTILTSFSQMIYSIFRAYEKMEFESLGQFLNAGLILFGVLLAMILDLGVVGVAFFFLLASIVVLIVNFIVLNWRLSNPPINWLSRIVEIDRVFLKATIKEALPFGLAAIFVTIFYWIDSVMLSLIKGDEVVGWYNAAYRMLFALGAIPMAFNFAIFPVMSRLYITSRDSLKLSFEKYFKYMVIIGIPIGVGITLLARKFILLLYGNEYEESIIALQILVWSMVFIFISSPFGRLFESSNKQIIGAKIVGICAVSNIALNLVLIPKYSLTGASIATVSTELLSLVLCSIWSVRIGYGIPKKELAGIIVRVVISSVLMGVFIAFFYSLNLLALVILAALLFFIVLFIIGGIDKVDISLIQRVVGRQKD